MPERSEYAEREVEVEHYAYVGNETGDESVGGNHVNHQEHKSHDERYEALLHSLRSERRADYVVAHHIDTSRHLTGFEHIGKVVGLFRSEVAGDLRRAAGDFVVDVRERIHGVVKHDGYGASDVVAGDGGPSLCA